MKNYCSNAVLGALALALVPSMARAGSHSDMHSGSSTNAGYSQMNLVSDTASNALHLDDRLLNAWGIVVDRETIWVNDNHSSLSTTYDPLGKKQKLAVNVPAPGGGGGAPTGLVKNDTGQFLIPGMHPVPARFLMSTEDGTITAWNRFSPSNSAAIVVDRSGDDASYKGLDIARDASGAPHLYAANFHSGMVDVFDGNFNLVTSFTDTNLPAGFVPFNIRTIRGRVFVTFAFKAHPDDGDDTPGAGNGFIDIFDTDGTLLRSFAAQGALDSPWGMAVAPKHFGKFSRALIVGNFGDGTISGYDLLTGRWLGYFTKSDGSLLQIEGLWGLTFERDEIPDHECDFNAQRLYFTAGPGGEEHGLLGFLRPVAPNFPPAR